MIFNGKGEVVPGFYVTGIPWSPAYVLSEKEVIIFEAGFSCMTNYYLEDIREIAGERIPKALFLTHVHWDHCGSVSHLKKKFPEMVVYASERSREILKRESAVNLMKRLSKVALDIIEKFDWVDKDKLVRSDFEPFDVDRTLNGGERIEIDGGLTVEVIPTPGHTRDHLSYYIPERKILVCTEASGCMNRVGRIITEFLYDYDLYLESLKSLSRLEVNVLCQGHHFVITHEHVKEFFKKSIEETHRFKDRVYELLIRENGDVQRVIEEIKKEEYDSNPDVKQPLPAYLINLSRRVEHLSSRMSKG